MINNKLPSFSGFFFFFFILCLSRPTLVSARIIRDSKVSRSPAPAPTYRRGATYAFSPDHMINYISKTEIQKAMGKAFGRWSAVIPMTFREVEDYESADIRIGWYAGDHGKGIPGELAFDGVGGTLAHTVNWGDKRLIHFDAAETWAVADHYKGSMALSWVWPTPAYHKAEVTNDLESLAVHEIGHALGLNHSKLKESVMYPEVKSWTKKVELAVEDVERVQAIYGSNSNFRIDSTDDSSGGIQLSLPPLWTRIGILVGLISGLVVLSIILVKRANLKE